MNSRQQKSIPVRNKQQIEAFRAACKLGREILDEAHRHIRPGTTTDEIDRVRSWHLMIEAEMLRSANPCYCAQAAPCEHFRASSATLWWIIKSLCSTERTLVSASRSRELE
jgi:hypothetical protein